MAILIRRWILPFSLAVSALILGWLIRNGGAPVPKTHLIANTSVTRIEIEVNDYAIRLQKKEGRWIDLDRAWAIDGALVDDWVSKLQGVERQRTLPLSNTQFGLDQPILRIRLIQNAVSSLDIRVGGNTAGGDVYVQVNNDVVIAEAPAIAALWVPQDGFRDRHPFSGFDSTQFSQMRVTGDLSRIGGQRNVLIDKGPVSGFWYLKSKEPRAIDSDRVTKFMSLIQTMTISKFGQEPIGVPISIELFGPATLKINLKLTSNDTAAVALPNGEWGIIYPVAIQSLKAILTHPEPANPLRFDRFSLQSIELITPKKKVSLTKTQLGHWVDSQGKTVTIPIHNFFEVLGDAVPTKSSAPSGEYLFDLAISSGNQREAFRFTQVNDNSFYVDCKDAGARLWLTGDIDEIHRQLLKLTLTE